MNHVYSQSGPPHMWTLCPIRVGNQACYALTTLRMAPGFCTLRAFTTWKMSTTPSVLQRSMVVAMAQNIPERLTVSLQWRKTKIADGQLVK